MLSTISAENCCGCGACYNACPMQAITFEEDQNGFRFPKISEDYCIRCGRCEEVCPLRTTVSTQRTQKIYAAVNRDKQILQQSASGGAFAALAKWIIMKGGFVYGCAWNEKMKPVHIEIARMEDLPKLQGSRYVQSDVGTIYRQVRSRLRDGKYVLFSGTPCQCAALRNVLEKEYEKLFCAELICHGVPSGRMFGEFVEYLENRLRGNIIDIRFRDKKMGWGGLLKVTYEKDLRVRTAYFKPEECYYYYFYFYKGLFCREACYSCKFACEERLSDFTIGDFWGVQRFHPELDPFAGVSVMIVSGEKALRVLNELSEYIDLVESSLEEAAAENGQLTEPLRKDGHYERLLEQYHSLGAEKFANWYHQTHRKAVIAGKVKRLIPPGIKRKLRSVLGKAYKTQ